ncbi:hypothetical protein OHT61_13815 [Streptomyces sp. NBC_00178]|uniref:hypothetical protein n=1 Tax=Streptomyces sp. NBC_00178 TaxID=2975672 RepID=UPI002E29BE5A|nr:hypothetical protein [Streptomyces sp. NBC_00178]
MDESPLRLLPWNSPEGRPCYLSTDHPDSRLSSLADEVEAELLSCGEAVLSGAEAVLADAAAGEGAVRFALTWTTESLRDVLRVAHCREGRTSGKL